MPGQSDWDDGTVNHAASKDWNSGVRQAKGPLMSSQGSEPVDLMANLEASLADVRAEQASRRAEQCEYERDSAFAWCLAPWRFTVTRADGDQTYSGGREPGVYCACEAHLADAVAGMADGDDVALAVTVRYDAEDR